MSADDDSKNPESEATQGQPDALARVEGRLDSTLEYVERLEERFEERIGQLAAENQRLRDDLEARQQTDRALLERVADLEDRTDWQRLVERVDRADGPQRSRALLQSLRRQAQQRQRDGREPVAMVDKEAAETALHHPDVHRTTLYSDMDRVAGWFDKKVCWYEDGELWLDLTSTRGELPRPDAGVDAPQHLEGVSGGQPAVSYGGENKLG